MYTRFMDMHSGGGTKTDWEYIFIELSEHDAVAYFEEKFNQSPDDIACSCCGENFSYQETDSIDVELDNSVLVINKDDLNS